MTEPASEFECARAEYDHALSRGISVSGEDWAYFAMGRIRHLRACLGTMGESPRSVLDFGCGSGAASPLLRAGLAADKVVGVDVSERLLEAARREHAGVGITFQARTHYVPDGRCDLAFCNGVFHHIPPSERAGTVRYLRSALRPGGLLALWENNPWNPGTRYVMSRIPFDRDAITLFPSEARRLLAAEGLEVVRTDYLFIFPRLLSALRVLEAPLSKTPLGAQYQVLARKPIPRYQPSGRIGAPAVAK